MDINNEIQRQIDLNDGSETRAISSTAERFKCTETRVSESLEWLIRNGYVKVVSPNEMNESERMFYQSDHCRILRNVSPFDEEKFLEKKEEEERTIGSLPNIDKFKLYVSKMEKEFESRHFFHGADYALNYEGNVVTISFENRPGFEIDFGIVSNLGYDESSNSIFYEQGNGRWTIELVYMSGKCNLIRHES